MNEATAKRARRAGEGGGFWGKRNERRRLTGDIDRPDHRATFGKNASPDRPPIGRYFSMLPDKPRPGRLCVRFRAGSPLFKPIERVIVRERIKWIAFTGTFLERSRWPVRNNFASITRDSLTLDIYPNGFYFRHLK